MDLPQSSGKPVYTIPDKYLHRGGRIFSSSTTLNASPSGSSEPLSVMATMSEPLLVGSRVPGETATSGALSFSVIKEMSALLLERTAMLELLLFERTGVFESALQLVPTTWRDPAETLVSNWYQTKANLSFTNVTSVNS